MKVLRAGKALLLAVATALVALSTNGNAIQNTPQNWFRRRLHGAGRKLRWLKSPRATPLTELSDINSLSELATRLNVAGFNGRRTEADFVSIFDSLRTCFKNFSPPPGLALNFETNATMSPDDLVRNLFVFIPPSNFIHGPAEKESPQSSFVEMTADEPANTESAFPAEDQPGDLRPLRTANIARSAKHILAYIIRNVYLHFRGPTCQQAAKRLDGLTRVLLRKNSKAAVMEYILAYSLIQGNATSAARFHSARASLGEIPDDQLRRWHTPNAANSSVKPGIYDPIMLVSYFDIVKAGYTNEIKTLEKYLEKHADERAVGMKLFGNSLANPLIHKKITLLGQSVGADEELLQKVAERIGFLAMDSSDAIMILMPDAPKVAAFIRGVGLFAFESVFKQNGRYVMPGLPCGGNLTGNMLETLTGKQLGKTYYVYKYTEPLAGSSSIIPESVWTPDPDSQLARILKEGQQANGDYMFTHLPRVCASDKLFKKCSKKPPSDTKTNEQQLCHFINNHQSLFFEVDGRGVNTLRKSMQNGNFPGGNTSRRRSLLRRSVGAIRRFFLNRTSAALVLGAGIGGLCVASGLAGILGGSVCAVGAMQATAYFRTLFAVTPFGTKPSTPLSLGAFLATDFDQNLDNISTLLRLPSIQQMHTTNTGETAPGL